MDGQSLSPRTYSTIKFLMGVNFDYLTAKFTLLNLAYTLVYINIPQQVS